MYVVVYSPSDESVYLSRELGDAEYLDARAFADEVADQLGVKISEHSGYVPSCCGDIRVEFRPDPDNAGHIWSGESFYFASEEW